MLSQKCKYAIRTILQLSAHREHQDRKCLKVLSDDLKIPMPYLGKIMQELVHKKIVSSVKGPNGGFYMSDENLQMPMIKVIEIIDGLDVFNACGLGLSHCSNEHPCPIHHDFALFRNQLRNVFEKKRIIDLAEETIDQDLSLVR